MAGLLHRSVALWVLGYPGAARADVDQAIREAREIGQAVTLMVALNFTSLTLINCGNCATALAQTDEVVALADEKGALLWKAYGMMIQGLVCARTDKASNAVHSLISSIAPYRSTGATLLTPLFLSALAGAHANLEQFEDAWRRIDEAAKLLKASGETWCEAEIHRTAGEIALLSPGPDEAKAQAYFERALAVARAQQAKSWELRAAMSMARLKRDQGVFQRRSRTLLEIRYTALM